MTPEIITRCLQLTRPHGLRAVLCVGLLLTLEGLDAGLALLQKLRRRKQVRILLHDVVLVDLDAPNLALLEDLGVRLHHHIVIGVRLVARRDDHRLRLLELLLQVEVLHMSIMNG